MISVYNQKRNGKNIFKNLDEASLLLSYINALEKGLTMNNDYFMVINDNVIFPKDFNDSFLKLDLPSSFNLVRINFGLKSNLEINSLIGGNCIIFKKTYVKKVLIKLLKRQKNTFNYIAKKIPKSYVINKNLFTVIYEGINEMINYTKNNGRYKLARRIYLGIWLK